MVSTKEQLAKQAKKIQRTKSSTLKKFVIWSGSVGGIFGLIYFSFPTILELGIRSQLNILEGGQVYPDWITFPIPIKNRFRFFEIVNPEGALKGEKIRVREVGPFCLNQWRSKKIIEWSEDKRRVKYYEYKKYNVIYDEEDCLSAEEWDKKMMMINAPIVALGATVGDIVMQNFPLAGVTGPVVFGSVNAFLASHGQNIFKKMSARDVIIGQKVNLLETINALVKPLEALGIKGLLPDDPGLKDSSFGILYGRNNTPEGPYEIYTGYGDTNTDFLKFISWKGLTKIDKWKDEKCNEIKGGDGTLFPPLVKRTDSLFAWVADICRSIKFVYKKDSVYKGIPVYRFVISDDFFAAPERYPPNECYCIHNKRRDRCRINGAYDLGGCQNGAPILVTKPHFLDTDPDLSKLVDGLNPNREEHEGYAEVEPITGSSVNGQGKLQLNLRLEQVPFLRGFDSIRNAVVPFVYVFEVCQFPVKIFYKSLAKNITTDQNVDTTLREKILRLSTDIIKGGGLTDKLADKVKAQLVYPVQYSNISLAGITGASVFTFIITGLMLLLKKKRVEPEPEDSEKTDLKPSASEPDLGQENPAFVGDTYPRNGLLPVARLENSNYAIAQPDGTIQNLPTARWEGILIHPNQLNIAMDSNRGSPFLQLMTEQDKPILIPLAPDYLATNQLMAPVNFPIINDSLDRSRNQNDLTLVKDSKNVKGEISDDQSNKVQTEEVSEAQNESEPLYESIDYGQFSEPLSAQPETIDEASGELNESDAPLEPNIIDETDNQSNMDNENAQNSETSENPQNIDSDSVVNNENGQIASPLVDENSESQPSSDNSLNARSTNDKDSSLSVVFSLADHIDNNEAIKNDISQETDGVNDDSQANEEKIAENQDDNQADDTIPSELEKEEPSEEPDVPENQEIIENLDNKSAEQGESFPENSEFMNHHDVSQTIFEESENQEILKE